MAYRKRKIIKRRSRVTKRAFKRARRTVRRKTRRILSTPVLHQSETIDTWDIDLGIAQQGWVTDVNLGQFPRLTALAKLYSEYKINKFTTAFYPKQEPAFWTGPTALLKAKDEPLVAITYNNRQDDSVDGITAAGCTSYNEAMNRPSSRKHSLLRPIRRTVKGTIMVPAQGTGVTFAKSGTWLPTFTEGGLPITNFKSHNGIGLYLPALSAAPAAGQVLPGYTCVKSIHVSFRGKRTV